MWAASALPAARIEFWADDPVASELVLRQGAASLQRHGERSFLSTLAVYLAEALYRQGRYDDAERLPRPAPLGLLARTLLPTLDGGRYRRSCSHARDSTRARVSTHRRRSSSWSEQIASSGKVKSLPTWPRSSTYPAILIKRSCSSGGHGASSRRKASSHSLSRRKQGWWSWE